jgi:gas vesicle protein
MPAIPRSAKGAVRKPGWPINEHERYPKGGFMKNHTPHHTSHDASYSALTFSFLAGGIAGATVALLLAPQSGKVTREIVGRKLNDAANSASDLKGRMVDTLDDAADSARELKDRTVRRGQEIRDDATYRVEKAAAALAGKAGRRERGNGDLKNNDSSA